MIDLVLEASTTSGSVALVEGRRVIASIDVPMGASDAERMMPAVALLLATAGVEARAVNRIVCGEGPGSFTGLRIAASLAKGLAVGWGVPLAAVSSLVLAVASAAPPLAAGRYLAVLDALRGEVYAGSVEIDAQGLAFPSESAMRVSAEALVSRAAGVPLVGPGQAIAAAPHAAALVHCSPSAIAIVDVASWEPSYGRLAEAQVKREAALRSSA